MKPKDLKLGYLFLENIPDIKWHPWDYLEPLNQHYLSHTSYPYCLVHYPWGATDANRLMLMYLDFDEMKWCCPSYKLSWEDVSLELDDITHWAILPSQPEEWLDGPDFENWCDKLDVWQIEKEKRKKKVKELEETYGRK